MTDKQRQDWLKRQAGLRVRGITGTGYTPAQRRALMHPGTLGGYTPEQRKRKLAEMDRYVDAMNARIAREKSEALTRANREWAELNLALRIAREHIDRCCTDREVARNRDHGWERAHALVTTGGHGDLLPGHAGSITRALQSGARTAAGVIPGPWSPTTTGTTRTMTVNFSPYNTWYEINSRGEGHFLERTLLGTFDHAVRSGWPGVKSLFDHGNVDNRPLGKVTRVEETMHGARGTVALLDATYTRDLAAGIRQGLYGSSFRFSNTVDEWNPRPPKSAHNPDGIPERTIRSVKLHEFGPVTYPANPAATTSVL